MTKRWNLSMTRWLLWRRSVDPRLLMLAITMLAIVATALWPSAPGIAIERTASRSLR